MVIVNSKEPQQDLLGKDDIDTPQGSSSSDLLTSPGTSPPLSPTLLSTEHPARNVNCELKGPPQACLFVASISQETTEDSLLKFFSQYGTVLKQKLLKDRSSRPYAFVQFSQGEEANRALQKGNGKVLDGRRLRVEKAKVNRTLFVAKFSRALTSKRLREVAEVYGPIESVTVIKHHQTNKSKGCGFIKYKYREDAIEAFVGLKGAQRKWIIEWATSANDPDLLGVDKSSIFIGGLNPSLITKELLLEKFAAYGSIENCSLVNKPEDQAYTPEMALLAGDSLQRSAFAFIRYCDPAASIAAIENENGNEWLQRRVRVQYCESTEMKTKRKANKMFMQSGYPLFPPQPYMMGPVYGMPVDGMNPLVKFPYPQTDIPYFIPPYSYPMYYPSQPWYFSPPGSSDNLQLNSSTEDLESKIDDGAAGDPERSHANTVDNNSGESPVGSPKLLPDDMTGSSPPSPTGNTMLATDVDILSKRMALHSISYIQAPLPEQVGFWM